MEDLDNSISNFTESILLPPLSWLQHGLCILEAFFFLSDALFARAKASKQPEDVIHATKYLSHLQDQPHEIPNTPRHKVTTSLVDALALQVELELDNVMQNIREMAVLSRELFTLETSDIDTTHLIVLLSEAVLSQITPGTPDQPLDELIESLRAAGMHRPDLIEGRMALAVSLVSRYCMTSVNDDYEEAILILDETTSSPRKSQDKSSLAYALQELAPGLAAMLTQRRWILFQSPEYLEEAIYRTRACSSSASFMENCHSVSLNPDVTAKQRSRYFPSIEGAEAPPNSLVAAGSQDVKSEESKQIMHSLCSRVRGTDDTTTIDEAVEWGRLMLVTSSNPIPGSFGNDPTILSSFGSLLFEAFNRTKEIEYLNESISVRRQAVESPFLPPFMSKVAVSQSLLARYETFPGYCTQDLDEALDLLSQYINHPCSSPRIRFALAFKWAQCARRYQHPTVLSAYETALSSMENTLHFSPTLQLQHATLATYEITRSLPLDYASYRVDHDQLEEAVETLERGRAVLWSEMRRLRVSIDKLIDTHPDLGHKFAEISRDLEELTKSATPSHKLDMDDATADGLMAVDPFGRLVLKQRALLKERARLISQIQALPSFESFLASSSFDTLRSAASSGPVIIINHSEWRSDILILLHDKPPSLILTPDDFFKRASALRNTLLDSRHKYGLSSDDYDKALAEVLANLYTLVGQPVIDRLHQLQVPEQSRIWWCPTSVFCSLPLHAMGPIPSDDGELRYFSDLYICSYTPTLSALIQSRHYNSGSRSLSLFRPPILLVAQLDPSLPTVGDEIQVVQALKTKVTSLISEAATPATAIDEFHRHQFVHFACHGTLETGKPFEAGFELHGDERLTLLKIVRAHLPNAEFAFLSACHTAEVTEGSIMDEGLHLAAAMQYCGFRSVVGTMWAMKDEDGPDLAKHFYKKLFSGSSEVPYHERSAEALRFAVQKLRRKRGITLERCVNFVHYGA